MTTVPRARLLRPVRPTTLVICELGPPEATIMKRATAYGDQPTTSPSALYCHRSGRGAGCQRPGRCTGQVQEREPEWLFPGNRNAIAGKHPRPRAHEGA